MLLLLSIYIFLETSYPFVILLVLTGDYKCRWRTCWKEVSLNSMLRRNFLNSNNFWCESLLSQQKLSSKFKNSRILVNLTINVFHLRNWCRFSYVLEPRRSFMSSTLSSPFIYTIIEYHHRFYFPVLHVWYEVICHGYMSMETWWVLALYQDMIFVRFACPRWCDWMTFTCHLGYIGQNFLSLCILLD